MAGVFDLADDFVIGIDLGATVVRAGAFSPTGRLLASEQLEIRAELGAAAGLARISSLVETLIKETGAGAVGGQRLRGIGVGATGPTDSARGLLINPGTLPEWLNVPVVEFLQSGFGVPVCLDNDADAAALGEFWQGAAARQPGLPAVSRLYAITVGTGIGTAFIVDGQVYRGAGGYHPEGGHQIVDPAGPACYCGANGCWESLSSGTAIGRAAREAILQPSASPPQSAENLLALAGGELARVDARLTAEAARQGDPLACAVIARAAGAFSLGVVNILMLFFPEMIVLSGGVMRSLDLFMPALQQALDSAGRYIPAGQVSIQSARLSYYAGIYGAAYAILTHIGFPTVVDPEKQPSD